MAPCQLSTQNSAMPVPAPPEYIVRPRLPSGQLQKLLLVLAALLLLAGSFVLGRWSAPARSLTNNGDASSAGTAETQALKQKVAILLHDRQVTRVATDALRRTLADRGAEIDSLRADLAFYTRLVGGDEKAPGLNVAALSLAPVESTRGYTFNVTLLQTSRGSADPVRGVLTLAIEGVQGGKATRYDWAQLADSRQRDGLPFAFKYFQQLHGMLVLPAGFVPVRIQLTLKPAGSATSTRDLSWTSALAGKDKTNVPQNP